ncbi:Fic family protein [Pseudonocardia benzenivorans]
MFGDVYEWAGELRTVTLGKTGQMFCPPHDIKRRAGQLFLGLAARDHLRGLDREHFLDELTELLAALTFLHPFREETAGHSARCSLSSPATPGTPSDGPSSTPARTPAHPAQPTTTAISSRCGPCSTPCSRRRSEGNDVVEVVQASM